MRVHWVTVGLVALAIGSLRFATPVRLAEPVFDDIRTVAVISWGPRRVSDRRLEGAALVRAARCLTYGTAPVESGRTTGAAATVLTLVQVEDAHGDRAFEVVTGSGLEGPDGRSYTNGCFWTAILESPERERSTR